MSVDDRDPDSTSDTQSRDPDDSRTQRVDAPTEPRTPSRPGTTSAPDAHYRVLERLGRGGMGEVVAAQDEVLGRGVAIKRMLDDAPDPRAVHRFVREARIQARLDHPAIPPVHELCHDAGGRPYFVMKRLHGTPLSQVLAAIDAGDAPMRTKFPRQRLLRAFADVCLAVEFAHARGVIHRDLKPANVVLGDYGETYVIDWGIAKVVGDTDPELSGLRDTGDDHSTRAGAMVGTPAYMAPEQRAGAPDLDAGADVFALGCILFELLGGRSVDKAELATAAARRPSRHLTDVAPELDDACAAATTVDRTRRIATARELGDRVQRYLDGDRDLALRGALAADHLAAARTARGAGDDAGAMRQAGRALALDPKLVAAAELITRLMLEPPKETPADVAVRLAAEDVEAVKRNSRTAVFVYLLYSLFIPYFAVMGVKEPRYLIAMAAVLVVLVITGVANVRGGPDPIRRVVVVAGNLCLIVLVARMLTPFTIAPGLAAVTGMVLITSPLYRSPTSTAVITLALIAACLVPFVLEFAGMISTTTGFTGETIILTSPVVAFPVVPSILGLVLFVVLFIVGGVQLARRQSRIFADARLRVHLQAWRLRQLV
jgi:serine/threonine-protein kinase